MGQRSRYCNVDIKLLYRKDASAYKKYNIYYSIFINFYYGFGLKKRVIQEYNFT